MNAPAPTKRRGMIALLRALVPLLLIILVVAWFRSPDENHVRSVDPSPDFAYAKRIAPYPLVVPTGLPADWKATSSKVDAPAGEKTSPVTLTVGYVTSAGDYAGLTETDRPAAELRRTDLADASASGTTTIGSRTWQRFRTGRDETALFRTEGTVSLLVTGSAPDADLTRLAASLR